MFRSVHFVGQFRQLHCPAACCTQPYLEIKANKPLHAAKASSPHRQFSAQVSKLTTGQTTGSAFIISITPCLLLTTQIWQERLLDAHSSADTAYAGRLELPLSGPAIVRGVATVNTIISIIASVPALSSLQQKGSSVLLGWTSQGACFSVEWGDPITV